MSLPPIAWSRLFIEGVVIVVSILLAFAIDAWWGERQEANEAVLQVERVVTELESNVSLLEYQIRDLGVTTDAAKEFLARFGPDPDPVENTEVGVLFNGLFSSGTFAFDRNASQRFLASGSLTQGSWAAVRQELSTLLAIQQALEKRSGELRAMRVGINDRTAHLMPALDTTLGHESMASYPPSRFPYDTADLFSDMYFEGLIAGYAIRMEINRQGFERILERHRSLIRLINETRGLD